MDYNPGRNLREYMKHRGISQTSLAKTAGISRYTLIRKLNGKADFTLTEVKKIAQAVRMYDSEVLSVFLQ